MKKRALKKQAAKAEPVEEARNEMALSFRNASVRVMEADDDAGTPATVRMSVSSEEPVLTYGYLNDAYQQFYEILDHKESSIDMTRCKDGLVVLDRHYGDQIGLMDVRVEGGKMAGIVRFCAGERAKDISQDAANGLRRNVSVGYRVAPNSYVIEGEQDGVPVARAMSWMPYEASFEPVPADVTVGVGRALEKTKAAIAATTTKEKTMEPKEMAELFARAAKFGVDAEKVSAMLADGKGRAELDAMIVEKQGAEIIELRERKPEETRKVMPVVDTPMIGGSADEQAKVVRKYSVLNVLRRAAGIERDVLGKKVDCGFENEINDECRKLGLGSQRGGQFIIPHACLATRDFTVSGTSSASVATNLDAAEFIDVLRTYMVLGPLGVQFLPGLVGNVAIPKMSAGATGYWVAESGDITESQPTLTQVTGTPHTCGVMTDISRRLLLQSTPAAEQMVRNEIIERIARTVQVAVFQGTGADGQPSAITSASGINNPSVTQGTPTYAELLGFPGSILSDSAAADGQQWVFTGEVWQKLAATFTDGTAKAERVLDWTTKTCLGFPYQITEDVGANSAFFGNFRSVMVGIWGAGIDLNLDTASLSSSGGLRLVGLQDVDVMVRLGQALAYNTAVTS